MPGTDFDIYQTESGYTAVTNAVRRQILVALAKKDRQLPELVRITKKAKPTLSSVHMRELLELKLVEEVPHPTDKRKKIYRLRARRIGSSALPVDQLRSAVKQYVGLSPLAARVPLPLALDAIAAAPAGTGDGVLRAQAQRLGALLGVSVPHPSSRETVTALSALLDREGIARPLRLDLEGLSIEMELGTELANEVDDDRHALVIAAMLEGVLGKGARVKHDAAGARRVTVHLG